MTNSSYLLKKSREMRRALNARPRGMSAVCQDRANFLPWMALCREAQDGRERPLRTAKGGACPPLLRSCNSAMIFPLAKQLLRSVDLRLLWKFAYNFGWKGMRAVERYKRRLKRNASFPAFVVISVTNRCNLECQGCWVTDDSGDPGISPKTLSEIINSCKRRGSFFFGILGGEPLLYPGLFDIIARHPDCYFQIFTNGTLLTDRMAATMRDLGNVTPLISVEGLKRTSDERRGSRDVYERTMSGIDICRRHRLIIGAATSVCASNFDELVNESYINDCVRKGVHYVWYYVYRPVGPRPVPELALSERQILDLRRFIVDIRCRAPIMVVDAYWDADGNALCPGAIGLSHHINPSGAVEFCPPIQFTTDFIKEGTDLNAVFQRSKLLKKLRSEAPKHTRGCILLEKPETLRRILSECDIQDSSGRNSALAELEAMKPCPGHHIPGKEIPEINPLYRFAKKYWFFGFGAYG